MMNSGCCSTIWTSLNCVSCCFGMNLIGCCLNSVSCCCVRRSSTAMNWSGMSSNCCWRQPQG